MAMASAINDETQRNIKMIHAQLFQKLSDYVSPDITSTWNKFKNQMKIYIAQADLANCTDIFTICDILCNQRIISYGSYGVLSKAFKDINHQTCYDIVVDYTEQIQKAQTQTKDETPYHTLPAEENKLQGKVEEKEAEVTERKLKGFPSIAAKLRIHTVKPDMPKDAIYDKFLGVFNELLVESMELPEHIRAERVTDLVDLKKQFCRLRMQLRKDQIHLSKMVKGCLELLFIVETREALHKLWYMYQSGELLAILQKGFVSEELLHFCRADYIELRVQMAEEDYQECLIKMGKAEEKEVEVTERRLHVTGKVEEKAVESTKEKLEDIGKAEEKEVEVTKWKLEDTVSSIERKMEEKETKVIEKESHDKLFSSRVLFSEKDRQTQQSTYEMGAVRAKERQTQQSEGTFGAVRAKERQTRQAVLQETSMTTVPDKTTRRSQPLHSGGGSDVKQTSLSGTFHCKFSVGTSSDKLSPNINRMTSMPDGRICLVNRWKHKIKLYTDNYVLCDKVRVLECTAVTCVDDDTVAVATYYGDITRYSVKGNKITQTGRALHIDGFIYDIAYRRGEFITRYNKHNTVYTCCGSKVIVKQHGAMDFNDCMQYDPVSDCVILSNSISTKNTVNCYTLDGDVNWRVTLHGGPTGMVVVHGVVLVADYDKNTIRQIAMDGRLLSTPLLTKHSITHPRAITYQHKQHRLLVTSYRDESVMVFNVTQSLEKRVEHRCNLQ